MKFFLLISMLVSCGVLSCSSGSSSCSIAEGTSIPITRANPTGNCGTSVVTGVTSLNGTEIFTPQKQLSCGVTHFTITVDFINQGAANETCSGSDAISFTDLQPTGATTGTDAMTITCPSGVSCTESFDITWTPQ